MDIKSIRTYGDPMQQFPLCPHVSVAGVEFDSDDGCEYTDTIRIRCEVCNEEHSVQILIN